MNGSPPDRPEASRAGAAPVPAPFSYCPLCAARLVSELRQGLPRAVCPACAFVHWRNPAVGVAVIVQRQHSILLGRRGRGAYKDAWCIPCGYVEYDEDVRDAAVREFREETGLVVRLGEVYTVHSNFHNPAQHSVGIWFRGEVTGGELRAGDDLVEVAWFGLRELPETLAFDTDRKVLGRLLGDC